MIIAGNEFLLSGTSASTPVVAGFISNINAARLTQGKGSVGWINPALYAAANAFVNDITSGNNKCDYNQRCCPQGFDAVPGWDPTTGLGSLDYTKMVSVFEPNYLSPPTSTPTPSPTSAPTAAPIAAPSDIITTVAGNGDYSFSVIGYNGDGKTATSAQLNYPEYVAVDLSGNIYIVQSNSVRKVTALTGIITTVAGTGVAGYNGDGITAKSAQMWSPGGVCIDVYGNIYISEIGNHRVRKVTALTGIITTLAGTGV